MASLVEKAAEAAAESAAQSKQAADENRAKLYSAARLRLAKHLHGIENDQTAISTYKLTEEQVAPVMEKIEVVRAPERINSYQGTHLRYADVPDRIFIVTHEHNDSRCYLEATCPACGGVYRIDLKYSLADFGRALAQTESRDKYEHTCYAVAVKAVLQQANYEARVGKLDAHEILTMAANQAFSGTSW